MAVTDRPDSDAGTVPANQAGDPEASPSARPPRLNTSFSVANINPGTVRAEFMLSIIALIDHERTLQHTTDPQLPRVQFDQFYSHFAGPYLDDERNRCIEWYLANTTSDYLLFIDSDISFKPEDAFGLVELASARDIYLLSGIYYSPLRSGVGPVVYRWMTTDDGMILTALTTKDIRAGAELDDIMPVDATGAGFMCIDRRLIKLIGDMFSPHPGQSCTPWFAEVSLNNVHMGEDMTFCVRSTHVGHLPHVAPRIELNHYKSCVIRPDQTTPDPEEN